MNYGSLPKLTQDASVDEKGIEKRIASGEMRGSTSCGEGAHLQIHPPTHSPSHTHTHTRTLTTPHPSTHPHKRTHTHTPSSNEPPRHMTSHHGDCHVNRLQENTMSALANGCFHCDALVCKRRQGKFARSRRESRIKDSSSSAVLDGFVELRRVQHGKGC